MKKLALIITFNFIFLTTSAQIHGMENDQTQFENIIVYEESGDMQTTPLTKGADQVRLVTWLPHLAPTNDTVAMRLGTWNEKHSQKSCKYPDQKKYIDAISCVLRNIEDHIEQKDLTFPEADNCIIIHVKRSDKVTGLSRKKASNPLATDKDPIGPQVGCCCVS